MLVGTPRCGVRSAQRADPTFVGRLALISLESDQVLYHAAKISTHPEVADQDELVVYPHPGRDGLLAGPRIDVAHIDIEFVEHRIALGRLALLENIPVEL